jgi:hypothetical protein
MPMQRILAAGALAFTCACAFAQAPASGAAAAAGATSTTGPTAAPASTDQPKIDEINQRPTQRATSARPGAPPPPLHIKIQDAGIALPKCTAESREGEACKKQE